MTKVPIDVDDDALAAAQRELGTTTKKDTVNEALRLVARRRERLEGMLPTGDAPEFALLGIGADITNPEVMKGARR